MSMYGVNASVPKTLVRHLVHYYADSCEDAELKAVLYDVLDTPVARNCFLQRTERSRRRRKIWLGPTNCMTFSCTICSDSDMSRKDIPIAKRSFEGEYDEEPSISGFTLSAEILHPAVRCSYCRMARK